MLALIDSQPNLVGKITQVPEGSLMPDTYYFYKNDTKQSIILRANKAMTIYLDNLWQNKSPTLIYKNKKEALILASMVEKESALRSEKNMIASVFINRLRLGMKLQSDPTVAYGLGKANADRLKKSELHKITPYNTYTKYGLPINPISNPSKSSLNAVFFPAKSNYLYFVADGSGGHKFATNLKDHNINVQLWRKVEQNIRKKEKLAS